MSNNGWFSAKFPKSSITGRITWMSLEILQDINKHDVCSLVFQSYKSSYGNTLGPGSPVIIQYGIPGSSSMFIGNVAKLAPAKKIGSAYEHTITCVAASRQLRVTDRNTWRNKTCPEVVQDIGKKLGFKVVTKQHGLRKKTITQAGGSYWTLLTELATMCGYALRVEGTTIYFLPLKEILRIFTAGAAVLSYSNGSSGRISNFTTSVGDTSDDPDDLADSATVTSFGPEDKAAVDVTEYPGSAMRSKKWYRAKYDRSSPKVIAHTREEARALARGMADRGMMAFDAQLECSGQPGLSPYHPVYIDSGSLESSGWWITKSVVHTIIKNQYSCEAVVSTDEVSRQASVAPSPIPVRDIVTEAEYTDTPYQPILQVADEPLVAGTTYTPDSSYSKWVSASPGMYLTPNTELLTASSQPDALVTAVYPRISVFPGPTLYPSS